VGGSDANDSPRSLETSDQYASRVDGANRRFDKILAARMNRVYAVFALYRSFVYRAGEPPLSHDRRALLL
jgi:hypothetical protein